jgi:2-keto-3-deoxy-L-rhamnonate aldolase RhmA
MGAEGLMLPMVGSPAEARQILDGLKYVPDGKRGVALGIAPRSVRRPTRGGLEQEERKSGSLKFWVASSPYVV